MNAVEWAKANPKLAAGGAGVVAVAGLALMHRRQAAAAAATPAAATTSTDGTAGLSGIPNTLATDIENAVQDQLNTFQNGVNQQIAGLSKPPTTPAPAPVPKPPTPKPPITIPVPRQGRPPVVKPTKKPAAKPAAAKSYTIPAGGTLWGAAQAIFGTANPANVAKLASQNNIKLYQRNGTTYADVFKGQVVRYQP